MKHKLKLVLNWYGFGFAIEPKYKEILSITISKERNMFVAEWFLSNIVKEYGQHPVSIDGALGFLLKHADS